MPCHRYGAWTAAEAPLPIDHDFALPGDAAHFPPDRPVDVRHVELNLTVDFAKKSLSGVCSTTMSVLFEEISEVTLQAAEMHIASVEFTSKRRQQPVALEFDHDGNHLRINLDRLQRYGNEFTLSIAYETTPRIGMSFVGPSAGDPDRAVQAHTQGQPEYAHYWFPCHDSPNDRATFSLAARVPAHYFAISNGRLDRIEEHPASHERTFYYHESVPFPAYIATLAVGDFTEIRDEFGEIPVLYYVRPGYEEHARRMMGDTPAMLAYYSERFGIRYPYEKYGQVVLEEFTGAMENTSATSHTWLLLTDERHFPDWEGKATVAHELVHQWFGDLMTCRDWSHAWLNESFATYFEETWKQADPAAGELEFRLGMRANQRFYLDEDHTYRRPIVYNVYDQDGQELFDRHLYEKGSCVLHMLRYLVGDAAFWRAIQYYARVNRGREVITADLERAFEESTGKSMGKFFDQWVYHGGHPDFEIGYDWDDTNKLAKISVKQSQHVDELTSLFTTPVEIACTIENRGKRETKTFTVTISKHHEQFVLPLEKRPQLVRFDPYGWILKTVKFDRSVAMVRWQLVNDSDPLGRLEAAEALAKFDDPETVAVLITALKSDEFWAVQAEAARSLGKIRSGTALAALLAAVTTTQHSKARRAIAGALGQFKASANREDAEQAANALTLLLQQGDASYVVEAEAAASLGKTRVPVAYATLVELVKRPSWQDLVARGALSGLGELATPEAATYLAAVATDLNRPLLLREGAIIGLRGLIATKLLSVDTKEYGAVREALVNALRDPWVRARLYSAMALRLLGDASVIDALQEAIGRELESRPRRYMRLAVHTLRRGRKSDAELRTMRKDVEELREENRKLRERLGVIEAQVNAGHQGRNNDAKHSVLAEVD